MEFVRHSDLSSLVSFSILAGLRTQHCVGLVGVTKYAVRSELMLCSVLFCSGPRIMMHTYSCIRYREASEYYTQYTSGTNPPPSQLGPTPLSVAIRTRLHRPKQCQEPSPRRNFTLRGSRGRGWARKEMSCVESLLCVSFSGPVCSPQFHFDSRDARMLLPTKE